MAEDTESIRACRVPGATDPQHCHMHRAMGAHCQTSKKTPIHCELTLTCGSQTHVAGPPQARQCSLPQPPPAGRCMPPGTGRMPQMLEPWVDVRLLCKLLGMCDARVNELWL